MNQIDDVELEAELRKMFGQYGKLRKLIVKKSKDRKYSFAFLEYETDQEAEDAIRELDQCEMHGKKMKVYRSILNIDERTNRAKDVLPVRNQDTSQGNAPKPVPIETQGDKANPAKTSVISSSTEEEDTNTQKTTEEVVTTPKTLTIVMTIATEDATKNDNRADKKLSVEVITTKDENRMILRERGMGSLRIVGSIGIEITGRTIGIGGVVVRGITETRGIQGMGGIPEKGMLGILEILESHGM